MKLTWDQVKAIEAIDKPTVILAQAGAGKTQVLTSRLLHILKNTKTTLNQILAITFTEKAACELKERIAKNLDPSLKKELPWAAIGTFHSFCLSTLRERAPLLGWSHLLSVWNEPTSKLAIHRHCRQGLLKALQEKKEEALLLVRSLEFRNALALLEELMAFRWHWGNLRARDHGPGTTDLREKELLRATEILYDQILKNYEEEKQLKQVVDFQDLEILTLKLLQENKEVLRHYQRRFAHILVDEAQDINDLQQELLKLLFDPKKNCLCIVGDAKQSIYRFRGANVEGFKKMVDLIVKAKGEVVHLNENFRARPGILQWINHAFATLLDSQDFSKLVPTREAGHQPDLVVIPIGEDPQTTKEEARKKEASLLAQYIQTEVQKNKLNFGDFALLFQSLTEVRHYEEAFKEAGIPYRIFGGRGFLSAQEVLDCLFCLKLMTNLEDRLSAVGLMRSPMIALPDTVITKMCLEHPNDLGRTLLQHEEAGWLKELWENKENLSAAEILEQAVFKTHYDFLLSKIDPSGGKPANVEQLIQLVRELETTEEMTLAELLEYFDTLKERGLPLAQAPAVDTSQNQACQLLTVHAAKGLEFPIVLLPDLIRSSPKGNNRYIFLRGEGLSFYLREEESPFSDFVPSPATLLLNEKEKYQDLMERKRLLYVAMTRAQERLVIPLHENIQRGGLWHDWISLALPPYEPKTEWRPSLEEPLAAKREEWIPIQKPFYFDTPKPSALEVFYYTTTDLEKKFGERPFFEAPSFKKREDLSGADVGNLVHAVLKEIKNGLAKPLKELVKRQAFHLELRIQPEEIKEITAMIESFLKGPLAPKTWEGLHELPFRLKVGSTAVITGIIDYLYETKEGFILYDFKTDAQFNKLKYKLQMDIYALALSKALAKPILETRLLYLKLNKAYIEPCTEERLSQTEKKLNEQYYYKSGEKNQGKGERTNKMV